MSISIEQGTVTLAAGETTHVLDLDSTLFPSAGGEPAPTIVASPQGTNSNYNVFISSLTKVGGSWRVTFSLSAAAEADGVIISYRAITRTI